jgi:hypothetical protein
MDTEKIKKTSIFATIPSLFFGISWFLEEITVMNGIWGLIFFIGSIILPLILLGIGWVKNFPKWTIISIGISIFLSLFLINVSSPMLNRTEVWGVIALIPLILTLIVSIVLNPSFQPLKNLYSQIKIEKNILIFLFYGIFPLILWMGFDEIHRPFLFIYPIILTAIVVATIILYLESNKKSNRRLILILGTIIPIIIAVIGIMNLFGK